MRPQPEFNALPPDVRELGPSYRASNPEGVRRWLQIERAGKPSVSTTPQATRNRLTFNQIEAITHPTLLITGGADLYAPPPVQQQLAERLLHAEAYVIPEVGHSSFWESPDVFNSLVLEFLDRVDRQQERDT